MKCELGNINVDRVDTGWGRIWQKRDFQHQHPLRSMLKFNCFEIKSLINFGILGCKCLFFLFFVICAKFLSYAYICESHCKSRFFLLIYKGVPNSIWFLKPVYIWFLLVCPSLESWGWVSLMCCVTVTSCRRHQRQRRPPTLTSHSQLKATLPLTVDLNPNCEDTISVVKV